MFILTIIIFVENKKQVVENQFEDSQNAETRRMVDLAKRQEARTAERMGYNPYEARLMGNTVRQRDSTD